MDIDDENTSAQNLLQTLNSYFQNEEVKYESSEVTDDDITVLHSNDTSEYPRFTFPVPEDPRYMFVFESPETIRVFKFYRHNNKPSFYCVGCSNTRTNKRKYLLRGCDWPDGTPFPISFNVPKPEDHNCEALSPEEAKSKVFSLMSRKSHGKSANAADEGIPRISQDTVPRVLLKRKKILKIPSVLNQIGKDFSSIIENYQIPTVSQALEDLQSTSRINNINIIQIALIKDEPDSNSVRKFIPFNDGLVCQFCKEMGNLVYCRFESDGITSFSGDHLSNCEPFKFSESCSRKENFSLQENSKPETKKKCPDYEIKGNILKVGDREYIDTDGDQECYYCKLCLKLKKTVVEAKVKTIVVEDEHCKECEESRARTSEPYTMSEENNDEDMMNKMKEFLSAFGNDMFVSRNEENKNSEGIKKKSPIDLSERTLLEIKTPYFDENSICQQLTTKDIRGDVPLRKVKDENFPSEISEFDPVESYNFSNCPESLRFEFYNNDERFLIVHEKESFCRIFRQVKSWKTSYYCISCNRLQQHRVYVNLKLGNLVPGFNGNAHRCMLLTKEQCVKYFDQLVATYRNPEETRKRTLIPADRSQKRIRLNSFQPSTVSPKWEFFNNDDKFLIVYETESSHSDFTRKSTSSRRTSMFNSFSPKQEPIFMSSPQPSSAALSLPYAVGTPTLSLPYLVPQGSPYHMSKPSFRMLNTLFKDEIPKDLYKVELNKEGGVAGILVRDASDFTKANEFRPTYKRKDGKSYTVSCVHCNKPLLEYNHGIEKLFLLGNLREHYCNAIPISVLEEKYELLRSSRKITRQWWMRKSQEHNFPLQMRYTTACRILRNLRAV
ncbi:hypothetical protein FO519_008674 [Halicephalobus sp. NKZ332]|nr:hypothetical protein FO519_008674 [Halicephalobus sp. NKZ332]